MGRHGALSVVLAIVVGSICALVVNTLPVFLTVLARTRGLTESQSGLAAFAEMGGIAAGTIGCALLPGVVERLNWRGTAALGLALMVAANVLAITVDVFVPFLAVRLLAGLGAGVAMAIVYAALAEGDGARSLAIFNVAQLGAGWLGIPFLSPIADRYGIGGLFGVIAVLDMVAMVLTLGLPRMSLREAEAEAHHTHATERISGPGWLSILSVFLYFSGAGAVFAYLAYMGTAWGGAQADVESAVSKILFAGMTGGAFVAVIGSRFGVMKPLVTGFVALLVAMALLLVVKPVAAFLAIGALFAFAWNVVTPFQFEAVTTVDGSSSAAMLVNAGTLGGMAVGPAIAGYAATADFALDNALGLGACGVSLVLILTAVRRHGHAAQS